MIELINETLQWVFIFALATPKIVQVVRDFRSEDQE